MLHHYNDILALTDKKPLWWDEAGVPRFCEFHPTESNNIYADEVVLLLIACQSCLVEFEVTMSWTRWAMSSFAKQREDMTKFVAGLHYGDPPCRTPNCSGCTMNCNDLKVLQFWRKQDITEWERVRELEIDINGK